MADKLDRFTRHGRSALAHAQEAATRRNQRYILPEHLLLGITRQEDCLAVKVMEALGVERERILIALEHTVEHSHYQSYLKPRLSESVKRVIELSLDEMRRMDQAHLGTEYLLLGLIRQGENAAFNLLQALGLSLTAVRRQTQVLIDAHRSQQDSPGSKPESDTDTTSTES